MLEKEQHCIFRSSDAIDPKRKVLMTCNMYKKVSKAKYAKRSKNLIQSETIIFLHG